MGMGYSANAADVISFDFLTKSFKEAKDLSKLLKKEKITLDTVASRLFQERMGDGTEDPDVNISPSIRSKCDALCKAFAKRYKGLTIYLEYHDIEQGDRYDEIDGAYWQVDGLYALTPGAKRLGQKNFQRSFFCTFG